MGSIIDALNPDVPSQKVVEEDIRSFWKMVAESEIELRRGLYAPSSPSASPNATITKPAAVSASQNASAKAKNNKGKGRATTPAPLPPIATTNNGRGGKEMTEEEKAQRRKELIEKYTSSVETKARSVVEAWKAARVDEQARLFELAAAGRNKVQGKQGQQAQGQAQKPSVAGGKATPVSQSAGNANVKRPGIPLSTPAVAVAALNQAQSQARPGTPMGKKQLKNAKAATAQAQGQVKKSEDNSSSTSTSAASSASAGRSTNTNATKSTFGTGPTQMGAARATPSVTSSPSVVPKFKAPAASAASSTPAPVRPGTPTVANVSGAAGFKAWGQVSVGSVNGPGAGVGGAGVPIAKPVPINAAAANATKLSILSSAKRSYKATVSDDIEGQDSASEEEVDSDDDEDDSDDSDDDDEDDEDDEDGEGNGKGVREGGNESPGSDGGPGSMHDIINESLPEIQRVSSPWKWMATSGDAHEHLHSSHGHAHPLAHSHPADRVGGDSSSWGWGRHGPGHVADRFLPGGTSSSSSNLSASPAFVSPSPNNARVNTPRTTSALGNANKSRERASSTARWYPDLSGAALPPFTSSARKPPTATPGMSSSLSMGSEGGEEDPARLMVEAAMQNLNEMAEEGREGDDLMRAVKLFANVAGTQW
ncbi:hypothetical protein K474DRAFT_1231285 [Panus rudis PR-1116 ss-1]|nr:hypothetical protein K474DRAFT_1231285 [Panus rudis PR-1116 ss-1]